MRIFLEATSPCPTDPFADSGPLVHEEHGLRTAFLSGETIGVVIRLPGYEVYLHDILGEVMRSERASEKRSGAEHGSLKNNMEKHREVYGKSGS